MGFIKEVSRRLCPGLFERLKAWKHYRKVRAFEESLGIPALVTKYLNQKGLVVRAGPFAGLKYMHRASGSVLLPKLVGSYEAELHPAIERVVSTAYDVVVDVGAAEGYYAVGLAKRLPQSKVFAYDIDPVARKACEKLAVVNGVADRVYVRGRCDHAELNAILTGKSLVVC